MPGVKICGVKREEHALVAWEAGADFVGLMFAPSKRRITVEEAVRIVRAVRERASLERPIRAPGPDEQTRGAETAPAFVGVFVNQPYEEIAEAAERCRLDYVQLHGDETPELCRRIAVPVIKAVRPVGAGSLAPYQEYVEAGARLLFDTYVPNSFGGSGVQGNWALAAELAQRYPLILAGGLDAANVAAAVRVVEPWAVDVSSGVETAGEKDPDKIRAFVRAVRGAE